MQGYQKTTEERAFEDKVKQFLSQNGVFFAKNFAPKITDYSNPDFFLCVHGHFVALEIENYTVDKDAQKPFIPGHILGLIKKNKGAFLTVTPDTFEDFKKSFLYALNVLKNSKSYDQKIKESYAPVAPNKSFTVEVKKKPMFQKKTDAFYQNRYTQMMSKKGR